MRSLNGGKNVGVKMAMDNNCTGEHRFFVADVAVVEEANGTAKVCPIIVCTACGEGKKLEFKVSDAPLSIITLEEKRKG